MSRLLVFSFLHLFFSFPLQAQEPVGRFDKVSDGIYRGARPTPEGLQLLAQMGVRTILNLDNDPQSIAWETEAAQQLGLQMVSNPMSGFWKPKDEQIKLSLSILTDPKYYPVFVHCEHGRDRSGLTVGLFRVFHEGWTPEAAYREMLDKGFRRSLVFLDGYYKEKTGLSFAPNPQDPIDVGGK